MRSILVFGTACFVLGIVLGVVQLWFTAWSPEVFVKIELTLAALFAIALVLWFTRSEYREYKKQRNDPRLDE